MKIFLSPELQAHRRGRFLTALLDAEPLAEGELPDYGLLLVVGEHFQDLEDLRKYSPPFAKGGQGGFAQKGEPNKSFSELVPGNKQQKYFSWARQPGCVLLLLPPWQEGRITELLDWSIGYSSGLPVSPDSDSVAAKLTAEVIYRLDGNDGASGFMPEAGQLWADHSSHTRYWKAHSNSGLIAATILPLWSISLINEGMRVRTWLECLARQAGKPSLPFAVEGDGSSPDKACPERSRRAKRDTGFVAHSPPDSVPLEASLRQTDYTVLVCCYGLNVSTSSALADAIHQCSIPFINLSGFDLPDSFARLGSLGLINESGLTAECIELLQKSNFWAYAEYIKTDSPLSNMGIRL